METIRVNMTPNPSDIQTIHCSQGDTEAREWEFELHNNGEVIDAGGITEQMVFKAYKGGTEQILPENGAVPVTAPFVGDIKYPDATRTDQEFLYRQSPTEEDGNAKIKNLYGNTLVWNQILIDGNFISSSGWNSNVSGNTVSASSNELSIVINTLNTNVGVYGTKLSNRVANHKYLFKIDVYTPHATQVRFGNDSDILQRNLSTGWNTVSGIVNNSVTSKVVICYITATSAYGFASGETFKIRNYQCFDLTQMGLDSLTVEQFASLFSKPYYDYCQGAMLSFGGRNVKFNQLVQNGNFADTSVWTKGNCTFNVSNNVLTFKATAQYGNAYNTINNVANHVCLLLFEAKSYTNTGTVFFFRQHKTATSYTNVQQTLTNAWAKYNIRVKCDSDTIYLRPLLQDNNASGFGDIQLKNVMVVDLTEMFGAGNEPSVEGFKELFPNDFYEYNVGQYMNLGQPVSLKTTGKNLWNNSIASVTSQLTKTDSGAVFDAFSSGVEVFSFAIQDYGRPPFSNIDYTISFDAYADINGTTVMFDGQPDALYNAYSGDALGRDKQLALSTTKTRYTYSGIVLEGNTAFRFYRTTSHVNASTSKIYIEDIQLEFGSTATDYEPYTESALSIPLDEFPNGMDGINDVKDEKNETGYLKRIGQITFDGTQTPVINTVTSTQCRAFYNVSDVLPVTRDSQVIEQDLISNYLPCNSNYHTNLGAEGIHRRIGGKTEICVSLGLNRGITTWDEFKAYLSAHPLTVYYPLNVPLENYGVVDLGTLDWTYTNVEGHLRFVSGTISPEAKLPANNTIANAVCTKYEIVTEGNVYNNQKVGLCIIVNSRAMVYDSNYTDAQTFATAMSGVYLLYEKVNPQGFTTATLVTENGEVALANENGVLIGKCTEELSSESGFFDAKIKLADEDGECYSNKIQLHIERSPQ